MLIRKKNEIASSEITAQSDYRNRRAFMQGAAAAGIATLAGVRLLDVAAPRTDVHAATKLSTVPSKFSTPGITPTSFQDITMLHASTQRWR